MLEVSTSVYTTYSHSDCTLTMSPPAPHPYLSDQQQLELSSTAKSLSRPGAGILAADETPKAMEARFASLNIDNTPEVRSHVLLVSFELQLLKNLLLLLL